MELGKAEPLGVLDEHDRGVGHVDSYLDHGRGHQHVELPPRESPHHLVLTLPRHLTVDQRQAQIRKDLGAQPFVFLGGRLEVELLRIFDQRVHHVCLPPRADLLADEGEDAGSGALAAQYRPHRAAPGRPLIEHRNVQVAVQRERQRAGNGGGGHDQHVRAGSHLCERQTLPHAEAVLLVHHHQTQPGELHRLLDQRMRSDHQLCLARGDPLACPAPFRRWHASRQELDPDRQLAQQAGEGPQMLLGQDLRGSHQRRLIAILHRPQHGEERDHRFSGADIPLEKAVHTPRGAHILADLTQDPLLGTREGERQRRIEGAYERLAPLEGYARRDDGVVIARAGMQELEEEELLEGKTAASGFRFCERGWPVHKLERPRQARDPDAAEKLRIEALLLLRRCD